LVSWGRNSSLEILAPSRILAEKWGNGAEVARESPHGLRAEHGLVSWGRNSSLEILAPSRILAEKWGNGAAGGKGITARIEGGARIGFVGG
jgi:hypothetical protein